MTHETQPSCPHDGRRKENRRLLTKFGLIAFISAIWFTLRTGLRPSRIVYPCQQAALENIRLFNLAALVSISSIASLRIKAGVLQPILILSILSVGSLFIAIDPYTIGYDPLQSETDDYTRVPIVLTSHSATATGETSDLFYVQNVTGLEGNVDEALDALFDLMTAQDLHFYKNSSNPNGLIGSDDVVILKMNGQWDYRGGTNTDLIKGVITAIINHPDGFTGEIVVADNGQGIGELDRRWANAYLRNQSAQDVVNQFAPEWDVSTMLWDLLRGSTVDDYDGGDFTDGYVRSSEWNDETEMYVSYPKFQSTSTGAYISFKQGVWNNDTGFDSDQLKVINMPVLKTHDLLCVTGCVKHYMGVPQGYVVPSVHDEIPHEHFTVARGGMGTMIAETRTPVLNLLDMIWVNAHPVEVSSRRGPWSTYSSARFTDIVGASVDPVALDYWSAKNVLLPTAMYLNYVDYSSIDPDYAPVVEHIYDPYTQVEQSFHNYLELSMNIMRDAGLQVTMDTDEMNVFVTTLADAPTIPSDPTTTEDPGPSDQQDLLPFVLLPVVAGILVVALVIVTKRRR